MQTTNAARIASYRHLGASALQVKRMPNATSRKATAREQAEHVRRSRPNQGVRHVANTIPVFAVWTGIVSRCASNSI